MNKQNIMIAALALAIAGASGFGYYKMVQYESVINAQGSAIRLMVETPEINAVVLKELQRRQASSTPQK